MKQYIKKAAFVFAASLVLIACEKDQTAPTNRMNGEDAIKNKNVQSTNKSAVDSATYFTLLNYINDVEGGSTPPTVDWSIGILNIESAVNHTKSNLGKTSSFSEIVEISATTTISGSGSNYELSGSNALTAYDDLIDEIEDAYYESDLYATYGSDAFISLVDITFDDTPTGFGSAPLGGSVWIKYYPEPDFPFCDFDYGWKALDLLGKCGSSANSDAAKRLESMVTRKSCNNNLPNFNCEPLLYTITTLSENGFNSSNLWDGTSPSNCISRTALINTWRPGIDTETTNLNPSPLTFNQTQVHNVFPFDYSVGKESIGTDVAHELTVSYAALWCRPIDPI